MKILHAASSYPIAPGGSTSPFLEEMLTELNRRGHDVTIVVPRVKGLVEGNREGVRVIGARHAPPPLQHWGYGRSLGQNGSIRVSAALLTPVALTSILVVLRKELSSNTYDLIHLHWIVPIGVLALALPRNTPVVVSLHGADARFLGGVLKPIARRALERADAIVAASPSILDSAIELVPEVSGRTALIPHGASPGLMRRKSKAAARRELGLQASAPVVVAVGRLVPKKGFAALIRALPHMGDRAPQVYIIGDGPGRSNLLSEVPPGYEEQVHLLGQRPREDVATWLSAADVVAVPSVVHRGDVDSGPVVLVEALASGTAVVATKVGMANQLVEDDINGFLLESGQPAQLAVGLWRALESAERLGRGASDTFTRLGGWDRVAHDLDRVYRQVMSKRSLPAPGT